jgi:hypothetical protein
MASKKGISAVRLMTIYRRQSNPSWDDSYKPSILATPQEAPSKSRAYILTPQKLNCRETHLLSTPERNAALLGLYHPRVIGLQEQRMLSPEPALHPLWTMPGVDRTSLPSFKGVIDVAERLGFLDILPRVKVPHPKNIGSQMIMVFPWCGDLLWAIKHDTGSIYCVNWTIKEERAHFKRPSIPRDGKPQRQEVTRDVIARHEVEMSYYEEANIRTIQVANEDIDNHVAANLHQLFLHHRRDLGLTVNQREEILHRFQVAFEAGIPPVDVILSFAERGRFSVEQCRSYLFQAIWFRQLRVDLFKPILINRPLHPESKDVIEVYANWFKGAA